MGDRFIAVSDYNAKHTVCGSRRISTKGRGLLNAIESHLNLACTSTGTSSYWPKDPPKTADFRNFCVLNGASKA